jgi:AcrR family transcriptional regulator
VAAGVAVGGWGAVAARPTGGAAAGRWRARGLTAALGAVTAVSYPRSSWRYQARAPQFVAVGVATAQATAYGSPWRTAAVIATVAFVATLLFAALLAPPPGAVPIVVGCADFTQLPPGGARIEMRAGRTLAGAALSCLLTMLGVSTDVAHWGGLGRGGMIVLPEYLYSVRMYAGGSQTVEEVGHEPVRPLRRDAERNRERILTAARELFVEQGLGVGVDEIARRAGVGMGTLYRRFPNKDALVEETLAMAVGRVRELAEAALATEPTGQALRPFLLAALTDEACRWAFVSRRLWTGRTRTVVFDEVVPLIGLMFTAGQEAGLVRDDAALSDLIVLLRSLRVILELTAGALGPVPRRYIDLMLDALRPSPGNNALVDPPVSLGDLAGLPGPAQLWYPEF